MVLPAMLTHQILLLSRTISDADIERLVDAVVMPLLAIPDPLAMNCRPTAPRFVRRLGL